jgi:long-subunit fatty acid transport protein
LKTTASLKTAVALGIFTVFFITASAQTRTSSPYSRFGIGDLYNYNNTNLLSVGGGGVAFYHPFLINPNNPASYHYIPPKTFLFEASVYSKFTRLSTQNQKASGQYATLGSMLLAFPVTKNWRSGFGLTPYSNMGYEINDFRNSEQFGSTLHGFEGSGGIHQFYWGNSIGFGERFSVGFNLNYLFGTLEKNRSLSFPDSVYMFDTRILNTSRLSGVRIKTGMQYHHPIKENYKLSFGLTYSPEISLNVTDNIFSYTYLPGATGVDRIKDTLVLSPGTKGKMVLPADFGAGLMIQKMNRWSLMGDFSWQNWENFSFFDRSDSLQNATSFSVGGQYYPVATTLSPYWKKMTYRFGMRYSQSYLELRDTRLNEFGISFGVALPMIRTRSTINLGMELGQRGTISNDLIKESYFRFSLGFSVAERWFDQRRYF